jgi:hypothetical protein
MDRVEDFVIEGYEAPYEPRNEREKAKRDAGLVPWRGRWVKPEARARDRAKELKKKQEELEEYKKHQKWVNRYKFKTKHFTFESTLPPHINEKYSKLLEAYFKEFGKMWKVRVPKDWGRLPVAFYRNIDDFHRSSGASGGVQAYYRFVDPRELHFFYDRRLPAYTTAVLFHEANHYLTDLMDERFQYPNWINESMAEYYGASLLDEKTGKMTTGGIQHGRLTEVRSDMAAGKHYNLKDLLGSEGRGYWYYTWGWTFVHFMMETPKYAKRFRKFFADLARGRDVKRKPSSFNFVTVSGDECLRVFMNRLGLKEKDMPKLQKEWYDHIKAMDGAELAGLELGGISAYREGRWRFRASRMLGDAIEKGSKNMQVYVTYAQIVQMKDHENGQQEALKILEKASSIDPLEAVVYAHRGYLTIDMGNEEEGQRLIDLAKELNPEIYLKNLEIMRRLKEQSKDGE